MPAASVFTRGLFSGAQINLESLQSLLAGGIAFYTPELESKGQPAGQGETFTLFADLESAQQIEKADQTGLESDPQGRWVGIDHKEKQCLLSRNCGRQSQRL